MFPNFDILLSVVDVLLLPSALIKHIMDHLSFETAKN